MENRVRNGNIAGYKRCAFTGYRPQKMPWGENENCPECVEYKALLAEKIEQLIEQGYGHFVSGGAMGMDTWAAEAVMKLKEKHSWILLEMVSPFDDQAKSWTAEYRQRHDHLFETADIVTATSNRFYRGCYHKRNRYMVDNADILLACFDGKAGGTKVTVDYANKNEVPVVMLPPTVVH